ncbi:asparagine synthase (glutamine-hydrolyzing) [Pseudonocardiaceae bacterium YIM PH 21723]|nr:asparagine synthase (glutamine-hydrolyzing) [Pseudonocardiaceae bacterium YIM PH 21723]
MCGITGWIDYSRDLRTELPTVDVMTDSLLHRGPDARGVWTDEHVAFGHRRLSIIDLENGDQPMCTPERGRGELPRAVITYGGEVYNYRELRAELVRCGHTFRTASDTEVVLRAYLQWGEKLVDRLNGMYAFAIWNSATEELLLVRDRLGVKPLYYYPTPTGLLFGSEPKAILANPEVQARAGAEELADSLLFLRTPGRVPFAGMGEVKPGHVLRFGRRRLSEHRYWALHSRPHTDDLDTTVATIRELLEDIVDHQLISDVPLVSLLSGGLDSSTIAALAQKHGPGRLSTFAVDFAGHTENFQPDPARPTADGPFARMVADHIGSDHHTITLDQAAVLDPAVRDTVLRSWDLPFHFGDLDLSLYLLFKAVREHATVALSGEAADEIFGGYLWFHDARARAAETFPWLTIGARSGLDPKALLGPELQAAVDLDEYTADLYSTALAEVPELYGETAAERRSREITYLTLTRFLPILLDKKDRMSMASGLEGRVPFCDHRLVEYVFNIPLGMRRYTGEEKALLRDAARDLLPEQVVHRTKAAYPSTQDTGYDSALSGALTAAGPLRTYLSETAVRDLAAKTASGTALGEFERIGTESTVRLDSWLRAYDVAITL